MATRAAAVLLLAPLPSSADFAAWKAAHRAAYASAAENAYRRSVFDASMRRYAARNAAERLADPVDGAVYGPDEYADRTVEESRAARVCALPHPFGVAEPPAETAAEVSGVLRSLGTSVDWRARGAVTEVKNQGQYGTCWSFGATGVVEGINVVQANNSLVSVSEQEYIDCCSGCYGYVTKSFDYLIEKKGGLADTEASYPYKGSSGSCSDSSATTSKAGIAAHVTARPDSDGDQNRTLAKLVELGPGAFLVAADCLDGYKSGIISSCGGTAGRTDHATLVVGAGETKKSGVPYFLVKNSWGKSFGVDGYYRVRRNTNPPQLSNGDTYFGYAVGTAKSRYHCDPESRACLLAYAGHTTKATCEAACAAAPAA